MKGENMIPPVIVPIESKEILSAIKTSVLTDKTKINEFEQRFSTYIGCDSLLVYSGRTALYVLLKAYGLKKGDEIIMPAYMCETVSHVILEAGYNLKFVDVEKDTYNISIEDLSEKISKDTKVILPVHMFGIPCKMKEIVEIADDHNAIVLEDVAQAMGTEYNGKKVGSIGDSGFFSLGRGKPITTMMGGIIVTRDNEIKKKSEQMIRNFPRQTKKMGVLTFMELLGYAMMSNTKIYQLIYSRVGGQEDKTRKIITMDNLGFRYTNMQASVGLVQLSKLGEFNNMRLRNAQFLMKQLKKIDRIILPKVDNHAKPIFLRFPIQLKEEYGAQREELLDKLKKSGIKASVVYPETLPKLYNLNSYEYPNANAIIKNTLMLPCHPGVKEEDLKIMVNVIRG